MYIEELKEEIEDDYEFSEAAAQVVDELCISLQKEEGMTRSATEDDKMHWDDPDASDIVYTQKAQKLIEQEVANWQQIGHKYYPDGDIDIWIHLTQYKEL